MSEKNESKVILKIVANEESKHIETNVEGIIDTAKAIEALSSAIYQLSEKDKTVARSILQFLISDCGMARKTHY